ncbi:MAG: MmgE/PrpD family protein [Chloroflexota bacterium]|nr:MmgE/PrpD family protein [Chloroflexota bacterium]
MSDETVERLASYATSLQYENLTSEVVHQAKRLVVDSLGCGLGGFASEPAKAVRDLAATFSGDIVATVLGTGVQTTPDLAAFANGTMVRYLDFNDTYAGKEVAHPSDNIPVVMAAAEAYGATGRDLIAGIVLAYEVQSAWADSFSLSDAGPWDQAVYATISTPLGAGKVMGLTQTQLAEAVRLSVVAGMALVEVRRGTIPQWKACAVANAGRNGIFAAMLAERGLTGPGAIFEGDWGFFAGVTRQRVLLEPLAGEVGTERSFRILASRIKRFPAGFLSQTAIEGALEARQALGIVSGRQVRAVHIRTFANAVRYVAGDPTRWHPQTRETADHSLPYVVACALHFGSVEPAHFAEDVLLSPDLGELMQKVKVELDPECQAAWPEATLSIVTVETDDGAHHTTRIPFHLGHYKRPMRDEDIEAKFRRLGTGLLTPRQQDSALEALWHLEEVDDLSQVMAMLVV